MACDVKRDPSETRQTCETLLESHIGDPKGRTDCISVPLTHTLSHKPQRRDTFDPAAIRQVMVRKCSTVRATISADE